MLLTVGAFAWLSLPTSMEPSAAADEAAAAVERLEFMKESARVYEFTRGDGVELPLKDDPLLRWDNPVSDVKDGTVFLWTDPAGRPVAAAQVFLAAGSDAVWLHEFQSLSEDGFSAARGGEDVWTPETAGVEMLQVPDAPVPAGSAVGRLVQMRSLARDFDASDDFEGKSRWNLRLLGQPLHRYGHEEGPVRDGALFVFAHGTDPEVFLLLEARKTPSGLAWHYGLAPMTAYAVKAGYLGQPIWSQSWRKGPYERTGAYFILRYQP